MAPEQLMGVPADGRADLWASGVILYELLTGVSPFLAETPAAVMHRVLQVSPDAPSMVSPGLPRGFDAVVARALAKKPELRFATARDFQNALLHALQGKDMGGIARTADPDHTLPPSEAERAEATRTSMKARRSALSIPPEIVAELERSLSRHIGPLARVLVKHGQGETADLDELGRLLADNIPTPVERAEFMAKVNALKKKAAAAATPPPAPPSATPAPSTATQAGKTHKTRINFTPEAVALAEKRLASYVGPLARVLIKDAVTKSSSLRELYTSLAAHIDDEKERREFLALVE
jgi:serine/threonine-protein kinase